MKQKWFLMIIITQFYACNMDYVEFKPIELQNDTFVVGEQSESAQFQQNLKQVLEFYNVGYKLENSKILIRSKLWEDKDLMWNYTNKANDPEWLKSHSVEK